MRWNDNRIIIFGLSTALLFIWYVIATAETDFQIVAGAVLYIIYLVVVVDVAEKARAELLPSGMSVKEGGYGDKKYRYLDEVYGDKK